MAGKMVNTHVALLLSEHLGEMKTAELGNRLKLVADQFLTKTGSTEIAALALSDATDARLTPAERRARRRKVMKWIADNGPMITDIVNGFIGLKKK